MTLFTFFAATTTSLPPDPPPSPSAWPLLLFYVSIAVGISFLCSLLEAALLASRNTSLAARRDNGSRGAGILLALKEKRIDDAISAVLTLNTIANSFGAAMAGTQAEELWPGRGLIFAVVLTVLILILSEIIPKTIGANYADALSAFVGYVVNTLVVIMRPALIVTRTLTKLLSPREKRPISRTEIDAFIALATKEGAIEGQEHRLMSNLLSFERIRILDVMTPRTVVEMLPASTTVDEFLSSRRSRAFSRIPIYDHDFDSVSGYVFTRDLLQDAAEGRDRARPLTHYKRKISFVPELAPIAKTLEQFMKEREQIAVTLDEHGGVSGLVTLEDLIETILGVEIVDEADRVVDLRRAAADLRDRRLETMRRQKQLKAGDEGRGE